MRVPGAAPVIVHICTNGTNGLKWSPFVCTFDPSVQICALFRTDVRVCCMRVVHFRTFVQNGLMCARRARRTGARNPTWRETSGESRLVPGGLGHKKRPASERARWPHTLLVRPERFERSTVGLEVRCSIQLS